MQEVQRNIIESDEVRLSRNEAELKWDGANRAWESATLVLAYDPEVGTSVTESGNVRTFIWQGARSSGLPTVQVLYEDSPPFLEVLELRFSDARRYEPQIH